jgi:hypothetical protein
VRVGAWIEGIQKLLVDERRIGLSRASQSLAAWLRSGISRLALIPRTSRRPVPQGPSEAGSEVVGGHLVTK